MRFKFDCQFSVKFVIESLLNEEFHVLNCHIFKLRGSLIQQTYQVVLDVQEPSRQILNLA